jgi:hypothetical protein
VLFVDGKDVRGKPLLERKKILKSRREAVPLFDTYQLALSDFTYDWSGKTGIMNGHAAKDFRHLRHEMVETAIVGRGVRSELVLNAMRKVRRAAFLPKSFA